MPLDAGALEPLVLAAVVFEALAYRVAEEHFPAIVPPECEERPFDRVAGGSEEYVIVGTWKEGNRTEEVAAGQLGSEASKCDASVAILKPRPLEVLDAHAVFNEFFRDGEAELRESTVCLPEIAEAMTE